ncbi:MAG TPA: TetR family transcriptional regulator [Pseudonocardia sp.]|nr:TetR family transcriptional regulator [Pseudonocardia sp.]
MARLTRAESQERTRRLLVEAATRLFLRDGFRATSLEAIGEEAGFSRGAVYSNFAGKTDIGIVVVDALYERAARDAAAAVSRVTEGGPRAWTDALAASLQASVGDPDWARLEIELAASATRDTLRAAGATRYAALRGTCRDVLTAAYAAASRPPPADPDLISLAVASLVLGLGVQRACDPAIPAEALGQLLHLLTGAVLAAPTAP